MKVIQVIPVFSVGGAEIMVENLCYELKKLGCDVIAVSLFDDHTEITDRMESNGVRVKFFDKSKGLDLSQIGKLCRFFKEEKPNVVHTHLNAIKYAAIAAQIAAVPVKVHTIHNIATMETGSIQRKANKFFFQKFGVIPVSLSKLIQDSVVEEYGITPKQTPVVLNGMPLEKYNVKTNYSISTCAKIVHVGRFSEQKNHKGLIKAFQKVCGIYPDTVLNLFGTGELEDDIKLLVKKEGLVNNVIFNGVSHSIENEIVKNDIFCLPSNYEGVPLTLIEAMASAMPIVATDVGGIPDMLSNNVNALICENDSNKIADCLIELIESQSKRKKLGGMALKSSAGFSLQAMAQNYLDLYKTNNNI